MSWHRECLAPEQRRALVELAAPLAGRGFYLAGGTAIALHLGHRVSADLDWFTQAALADPLQLAAQLRDEGLDLAATQVDRGTLHGTVGGVRVSLLEYRYPLLGPTDTWPEGACPVAGLDDLAAMKLSAIAQRGSRKDFVDIWALGLRHRALGDMLELYRQKFGVGDLAHVIYSLSYFDDAEEEPMPRMLQACRWASIRDTVRQWVRQIAGG